MQTNNHRFVAWGGPLELVLVVLGIAAWLWVSHHYIRHYSPAVRRDMRAAAGAWRYGETPDQSLRRYFEAEFGPLSNPTNREKVFLSFFDPDFIASRAVLMSHAPAPANDANVAAAVRWFADFRNNLSPQERAALRDRLMSPSGQVLVQRGTAQYMALGADFRGVTTPVFLEVLTTLKTLQTQ